MKWFRDRGGELSAIESALRAERPRLEAGLEREIADRVGGPRARGTGRPVLALLMTTGAAAAFLSFGGVGYAVDAVNTAVGGGSSGQTASDDQYGGQCVEYVNPHGQTIPPAGLTPPGTNPKGGENPDGFYQVGDPSNPNSEVFVIDLGSGTEFGPYPAGRPSSTRRLRARRRASRRSAARTARPAPSPFTSPAPVTSRSCRATPRRPAWYLHLRSESVGSLAGSGREGRPQGGPPGLGCDSRPVGTYSWDEAAGGTTTTTAG